MHNERFPQQWEIITNAGIDVEGKDVLDLGCGYGDMVKAMHDAGANVVGVESDQEVFNIARRGTVGIVVQATIESFITTFDDHSWDVIVCFSVLPYILDQEYLLFWIASHIFDCALLEIQLEGDGPGEYVDENDIRETLERHFIKVEAIGSTLVPYRNMRRTIWKCSQGG